jgi:Mrp family chromosome partitioning ATPase
MYNPAGNGALASDVGSFSGQHSPTFTPAEVNLDGPGLEKFINTARSDFDYVVIDAPPLEDSLNVLPSLSSSDGVLLLINSAVTRKSQVLSTLKSWSYVNGKILGVILNRAPLNL